MNLDLLKIKIREKLKEKKISINEAEKISGIGVSALRHFLLGRTKSPTLETFFSVTKALDIDVVELIDIQNIELNQSVGKSAWKGHLFDKLVEGLRDFTKEKNLQISSEEAIRALIEIYCYCHKKDLEKVDKDFIELFLETFLKKGGFK